MTEQNDLYQELAKLRDKVHTLKEKALRTTAQMGETRASLSRNLERMSQLVNQLEDGIHELEAHVSEAHHDARELRRQASTSPTGGSPELAARSAQGAEPDQPKAGASTKDSGQGDSSDTARPSGEQAEIQEQMAQTLAELHHLLGELKSDLPPQ